MLLLFSSTCLFCANLLLLRRRDPGVYMPLAMLFLFQGISSVLNVLNGDAEEFDLLMRISLVLGGLDVVSPFLFWLYVRGLTSEGEVQRVPRLHYHVIPMVIVTLCLWTMLFFPTDLVEADIADDDPRLVVLLLIVLAVFVGDLMLKVMIGTYVYLTMRRLVAYRARLKEVFASTENRELSWIWVIIVSAAVFLLLNVALSASIWIGALTETNLEHEMSVSGSVAMLALFWVLGVWGLRQRPGLIRTPVVEPPGAEPTVQRKYEKSALNDERAQRIAGKIEAAMVDDLLYRDPNLSLWDLAKHIGVTSHYVSQTLNTHLDSNFFDLVNRWRIKDAIKQLNATDETILVIAYDVGFNSRSAFYKAFKRETGKTPSEFRK